MIRQLSADVRDAGRQPVPERTPASLRVRPMSQTFHLREQAERARRLARDSINPVLRDSLFALAEEFSARADAQENENTGVWQARPDDDTTR